MQVQLTEEQVAALKQRGARERVSVAELVRQAVDALVAAKRMDPADDRKRRALSVVGRFASGRGDVSAEHDSNLADAFTR